MSNFYGIPYFQAEPDPAFAGRTLLTAAYNSAPGQQQHLHVVNADLPHVYSAIEGRMVALRTPPEAATAAQTSSFTAVANRTDANRTIITVAYNPSPTQQQKMNLPNGDLPHLNWAIGSMITQLGMTVPA